MLLKQVLPLKAEKQIHELVTQLYAARCMDGVWVLIFTFVKAVKRKCLCAWFCSLQLTLDAAARGITLTGMHLQSGVIFLWGMGY